MYIINPIWFYLIGVVENIHNMGGLIIVSLATISFALFFYYHVNDNYYKEKRAIKDAIYELKKAGEKDVAITYEDFSNLMDEQRKKIDDFYNKRTKRVLIICMSFMFVLLFIPSKETCYQMLVSSIVTTDNVQTAHDFIANDLDSALNKITDSIIKVKNE